MDDDNQGKVPQGVLYSGSTYQAGALVPRGTLVKPGTTEVGLIEVRFHHRLHCSGILGNESIQKPEQAHDAKGSKLLTG